MQSEGNEIKGTVSSSLLWKEKLILLLEWTEDTLT